MAESQPVCVVCHGEEGPFTRSGCNCRGSVGFYHDVCLAEIIATLGLRWYTCGELFRAGGVARSNSAARATPLQTSVFFLATAFFCCLLAYRPFIAIRSCLYHSAPGKEEPLWARGGKPYFCCADPDEYLGQPSRRSTGRSKEACMANEKTKYTYESLNAVREWIVYLDEADKECCDAQAKTLGYQPYWCKCEMHGQEGMRRDAYIRACGIRLRLLEAGCPSDAIVPSNRYYARMLTL